MTQDREEYHHPFEEMAVAHVLGGLDETDGRLFRSHLLECSDCRARVGELRALAHDLADVDRDERRVRAAKALETKRRETEEDDEETPVPQRPVRARRVPTLGGVIALVLVLGLVGWIYTLRGTVAAQETLVDNVQTAASVIQFGDEAEIVWKMDAVEATVSTRGGRLAVLLDGVPQEEGHVLSQLDADGAMLESGPPVEATDGRLFLLGTRHDEATQVLVTRPGSADGGADGNATGDVDPTSQQTVLEARL